MLSLPIVANDTHRVSFELRFKKEKEKRREEKRRKGKLPALLPAAINNKINTDRASGPVRSKSLSRSFPLPDPATLPSFSRLFRVICRSTHHG